MIDGLTVLETGNEFISDGETVTIPFPEFREMQATREKWKTIVHMDIKPDNCENSLQLTSQRCLNLLAAIS